MNRFTVVTLTFLICMTVLSTTEGRPLRCQCVKTYSGRIISSKKIVSINTTPAGPHCKNVEIIATIMHKQQKQKTCLKPSEVWVKSLIEEWNQILNGSKNQTTS